MDRLVLIYPRGRMELNVPEFFPCKLDVARKIFPFIGRWASDEDFDALWDHLTQEYELQRMIKEDSRLEADRAEAAENIQMQKHYLSEYRKADALQRRIRRNIELLIGGRDR